jgi:hypothetical protein
MTPQFLRHEAARFRGMAEGADREATKVRLLAMAADYEARAGIDNELTEPSSGEATSEANEPTPDDANTEAVEPTHNEAPTITPGRKIARGLKETMLIERRPVGRPRRE